MERQAIAMKPCVRGCLRMEAVRHGGAIRLKTKKENPKVLSVSGGSSVVNYYDTDKRRYFS